MNNPFKMTVAGVVLAFAVGLSACDKNHDVIPVEKGAARAAANVVLPAPKVERLTQAGKMKVYYDKDGRIEKADDSHHRIQYAYHSDNTILVNHFYDNNLRWTTQIKLDADGRCISSKSTNTMPNKPYVSDQRELSYTYDAKGRLIKVNGPGFGQLKPSGYEFEYYPDNHPTKAGDLIMMEQKNEMGKVVFQAAFDYGSYMNGTTPQTIPMSANNGKVNQGVHLSDWGAEPFADIIDFFLPIYGTMSPHLVNYIILIDPSTWQLPQHNIGYSLDIFGYIEGIYIHDEKTVMYTYELVTPVVQPKL